MKDHKERTPWKDFAADWISNLEKEYQNEREIGISNNEWYPASERIRVQNDKVKPLCLILFQRGVLG